MTRLFRKLSEFCSIKHGFAFQSTYFGTAGTHVVLSPGNFHEKGGFRENGSDQRYYIAEVPEDYVLNQNDLLVVMTEQKAGLLGSAALIPESRRYLHNQRLGLVTGLREEELDRFFLFHLLNSQPIRQQISVSAGGTKVRHSSPGKILDVTFHCPPLPDQRKIAAVLSTWDRAIELIEKVIASNQKRKQGLVQQLLSGRVRMPGFRDKWEPMKASDIFKSVSIKNRPGERVLSVTQDMGVVCRDEMDRKIGMSMDNTGTYKFVMPGDFVISLRSFQGGLEMSRIRGIVSPAYHVIQPIIDIDREFFRHFFKSYEFVGRLAVAVIGIRDGKQIDFEDFGFLKFQVPPLDEQKEIAAVLNTQDREIELLQQKLDALRRQKKGLMQQLLTGKVRVKVTESLGV